MALPFSMIGGMITAKSQSERTDVFTEVTNAGAMPQGFANMIVKANIVNGVRVN